MKNLTCGRMAQSDYLYRRKFEGTSKVTVDGKTNEVTVYTPEKIISVEHLMPESEIESYVIFSRDGRQTRTSTPGYLKINDNTMDYLPMNLNQDVIKDIAGIYYGTKISTITDTFYDAEYYLSKNKKVMLILLDGFSYAQWMYCSENGYSPFLSGTGESKKVLSAYKPVTNTGMATMITGQTPNVHGVHDRSVRSLNCESIFNIAIKQNKKACLVEGDVKILNTEIEPILNIDRNKNGRIDDEILESAQEQMSNHDLCFVHFHGIDDSGHTYGPFAQETLTYISEIDHYVKTLVSEWDGVVIITADHGMHTTEAGGNHGSCRFEDMIVPYIVINPDNS
ncbi:MAG: alkaline phosphatase family protein [Clostridia bacterium]|nr:alkaline phosphatase family protein [Clostridia bacterium]